MRMLPANLPKLAAPTSGAVYDFGNCVCPEKSTMRPRARFVGCRCVEKWIARIFPKAFKLFFRWNAKRFFENILGYLAP